MAPHSASATSGDHAWDHRLVRGPPLRLKGRELQDTEDGILADVERGQLERGTSPWGSWAFPVYSGAKVRVVVNYQRVNSTTVRAIYYLRRADDCKQEVLGSCFISLLDAVSGFNQVPNSERARRVLAVLSASGCYLPNCLTLGGSNGPEDFSFAVDTVFGMGRHHERRLNRQWVVYIDDFACRSGLGGSMCLGRHNRRPLRRCYAEKIEPKADGCPYYHQAHGWRPCCGWTCAET